VARAKTRNNRRSLHDQSREQILLCALACSLSFRHTGLSRKRRESGAAIGLLLRVVDAGLLFDLVVGAAADRVNGTPLAVAASWMVRRYLAE
jgi:hypothetical protein